MEGSAADGNLDRHHLRRRQSQLLRGLRGRRELAIEDVGSNPWVATYMIEGGAIVLGGEEGILEHLALLRPLVRALDVLQRAGGSGGVLQCDPTRDQLSSLHSYIMMIALHGNMSCIATIVVIRHICLPD